MSHSYVGQLEWGDCSTCGHIAQAHDLESKSPSGRVCCGDEFKQIYYPQDTLYKEDIDFGYSCTCVKYKNSAIIWV